MRAYIREGREILTVIVTKPEMGGAASSIGKVLKVWKSDNLFYIVDDSSLSNYDRLVYIDSTELYIPKNLIGGKLL